MQSSSCNDWRAIVSLSLVVTGCAAPAPDLPRRVSESSDSGYGASVPVGAAPVHAGRPIAMIAATAWQELTGEERARIEATHELKVVPPQQFGVVIDVQGENQSTPGSTAGSNLGAAVAGAGYVDHAIRSGNYSALNQLGIGVLGAAIGSTADTMPTSQFQFRYTIRLGDGEIKYFDEVKSTSFRHSVGVCLLLPSLTLISQQVCRQSAEAVRKLYLSPATPSR